MVQIVILFSELYSDIPEQLCCWGSLVSDTRYLGIVLCRDYENGLADHMAIMGHDGPISDFRSQRYIQTFPNSYVFGVVCSLTKSVSALYYVETMKMMLLTMWPSSDIMVQQEIFFL